MAWIYAGEANNIADHQSICQIAAGEPEVQKKVSLGDGILTMYYSIQSHFPRELDRKSRKVKSLKIELG